MTASWSLKLTMCSESLENLKMGTCNIRHKNVVQASIHETYIKEVGQDRVVSICLVENVVIVDRLVGVAVGVLGVSIGGLLRDQPGLQLLEELLHS